MEIDYGNKLLSFNIGMNGQPGSLGLFLEVERRLRFIDVKNEWKFEKKNALQGEVEYWKPLETFGIFYF